MRQNNIALALLTAAVLAACGGNGSTGGEQSLKNKFASQVTFGDSLSDVGTYKVGTVAALGGGEFAINGNLTSVNPALTGKNWTELMAAQLGLPAPCAAVTGLDGQAAQGFAVPVVAHAGCFNYAQGGSRVTNAVGPGNKLTGSALGALTMPVAVQVQNHLNVAGGKFNGTELVLIMAGANDVFMQLAGLKAGATAAGNAAGNAKFGSTLVGLLAAGAPNPQTAAPAIGAALQTELANPAHTDQSVVTAAVTAAVMQGNNSVKDPAVAGAIAQQAKDAGTAEGTKVGNDYFAAHGPDLVAAMTTAATDLNTLVKTKIIGNGANYVVVNNLPDIGTTPLGRSFDAGTLALVNSMVKAFNDTLASGLGAEAKVALVDTFAASHDQATNPGPYGLTNVTTPACDLTPAKNPLGNSLGCNGSNLIAGDVSHYAFADDVHPTPFVQLLLARYVSKYMVQKGWI
ncbi:SGNH/GDSL hydrolase family protein [Massilia sp. R2A-15]|uniref:SGNH/GDSL hydrolase family protein n=1 Tax=Massilia sp. R2A-15 TaxID=3064278 RepID=UPI0027344195|nr:SGNH/GDSL hydrolase family protein [Massilia sp. R2A-15]WLI88575.1 SGNH/GDSL hydrolase family protein [Massilia sp. R2A-15]